MQISHPLNRFELVSDIGRSCHLARRSSGCDRHEPLDRGNSLITRPGIINVNGWPPLIQYSGIVIQKKPTKNILEEGGIRPIVTPVVAIFDKGS